MGNKRQKRKGEIFMTSYTNAWKTEQKYIYQQWRQPFYAMSFLLRPQYRSAVIKHICEKYRTKKCPSPKCAALVQTSGLYMACNRVMRR